MLKVNNKNTSCSLLLLTLVANFDISFSSISIIDLEQVNVNWVFARGVNPKIAMSTVSFFE